MNNLGEVIVYLSQNEEAIEIFEKSLAIFEKKYGEGCK